ncbi:hypothetical protein, partial [Rhizobium rhizogenes]|uniref:hypothetical protein n=1 Tax=Rhizobium rhizogenes TaxID=359 RepID=UPI0022C3C384
RRLSSALDDLRIMAKSGFMAISNGWIGTERDADCDPDDAWVFECLERKSPPRREGILLYDSL